MFGQVHALNTHILFLLLSVYIRGKPEFLPTQTSIASLNSDCALSAYYRKTPNMVNQYLFLRKTTITPHSSRTSCSIHY